jgi:hypothetical protein
MNKRMISVAAISVFALGAGSAVAAPVKLTKAQLDAVVAGIGDNWTQKKENGGGNEPKGQANGVPTVVENPGGNRPPGQN